jgi:hypothetical protein
MGMAKPFDAKTEKDKSRRLKIVRGIAYHRKQLIFQKVDNRHKIQGYKNEMSKLQ